MTILNDPVEKATICPYSTGKRLNCQYLKEHNNEVQEKCKGLHLNVNAMAMPVGVRLGNIAKTAYADLVGLCRTERTNYPKSARLFFATKRASRAISIEVFSLGMNYPEIAAAIAISFVAFNFVFQPKEGL
ncbi:MAG: hypothetical protein Q8L13_06415 [Bradyrhizobium sp.]|uniref:hypothetical protein n=1 Tax=Bradyrhizobium sp. TaxID=376 RepID=UPI0027300E27|nr:hypothetical protein [Bradyrhizobium sp.]MDP1865964.1 hypothetical protein [Bradyrhizobium sp.]